MRTLITSLFTAGLLSLFALPTMADDGEATDDDGAGELALPDEASEQGRESSADGLDTATEAREKRDEFGRDRAREARERRPDMPTHDHRGGGRPDPGNR